MAANIGGSLSVTTREPLDDKYLIQSYTNIDTGLTYNGILRFDTSTNKLYIKLDTVWSEIPTSVAASSSSFTFGATTSGNPAAVVNSGTAQNPILSFTVPTGLTGSQGIQGIQGFQGVIGATGLQGPAFTINAVGTSVARTTFNNQAVGFTYLVNDINAIDDGSYYVYQGSNVWSSPVPFKGPTGKSIFIAYAEDYSGNGRTFIQGATTKFISFLSGTVQPSINAFSLWSPISGPAGTSGSTGSDATKLTRSGDTITGNILNTGTGVFQIPSGLTSERPTGLALANGMRRYNSEIGRDEFYAAGAWQNHARLSGDTFSGPISATNLSGTNTGDNATNSLYSGLISNAAHTGDVTGSATTPGLILATVNANIGSFTNANITVNAKGLVTAVTSGGASTGTVTAVSIAPANGISGTSSGGATPAITLALGAITPTSVIATGTIVGTNIGSAVLTTTAQDLSSAINEVLARNNSTFDTLATSGTITANTQSRRIYNANLNIVGNGTLVLSNLVSGATGTIVVTQDATGNRTLTAPANSNPNGILPLNSNANSITVLGWIFNGITIFWRASPY